MVVAKLRKRSQFDVLAMKRMSISSLSDNSLPSCDDSMGEDGEDVNLEEQFLYESGGNIGE